MMSSPRPYQVKAYNEIQQAAKVGFKKILAVSPTGSGKSIMIFDLIKKSLLKGKRVLAMVPLDVLLQQFIDEANLNGLSYGVIHPDHFEHLNEPLQIATYQSLANRPFQEFDLVIIDEAHIVSGCHDEVMAAYDYIIGFTATPARTDGMSLLGQGRFQKIIEITTAKELTPKYLCPFVVFSDDVDFSADASIAGVTTLNGRIYNTWAEKASDRQTIIFASSIEHSFSILNCFRGNGQIIEHVDAKTRSFERKAILTAFKKKEIRLLTNYALFALGVNVPSVNCVVVARRSDSLGFWRQACGRGQRPGKENCYIIDHGSNVDNLGMPDDDVDWMAYNSGTKSKTPKSSTIRCDTCGLRNLRGVTTCNYCGIDLKKEIERARVVIEMENELVERTESRKKEKSKSIPYQCWLNVATKMGREPKWARYMLYLYSQRKHGAINKDAMRLYLTERKQYGLSNSA